MRDAPEKLFVMNFPKLMPPTLISRDLGRINAFRDTHGAVVMKPLHSWRRRGVPRDAAGHEFRFASIRHVFRDLQGAVGDPALPPEIEARRHKRIILVDGEFAGAGPNRVPAPDDCAPTWSAAAPRNRPTFPSAAREICTTLGPALRERGLLFVGIDVIDGNLTEINVTSPTGIRAIARLGGPDVAAMIWDGIQAKRQV